MRSYKQAPKRDHLKWSIFERDSYTCILCTDRACDIHHAIPRSQGGGNHPCNLVSLCRFHHIHVHGTRVPHFLETPEECEDMMYQYLYNLYGEH